MRREFKDAEGLATTIPTQSWLQVRSKEREGGVTPRLDGPRAPPPSARALLPNLALAHAPGGLLEMS